MDYCPAIPSLTIQHLALQSLLKSQQLASANFRPVAVATCQVFTMEHLNELHFREVMSINPTFAVPPFPPVRQVPNVQPPIGVQGVGRHGTRSGSGSGSGSGRGRGRGRGSSSRSNRSSSSSTSTSGGGGTSNRKNQHFQYNSTTATSET